MPVPISKLKRRGRPPTYANPTEREREKKRRQRAKKAVVRGEHPDRVVSEAGLLWFEVWVSVHSTTPDGLKMHTEGYRRFGEYPSSTPYGLCQRLPSKYRARAKTVLEAMGLLPKRSIDMWPRKPEHDYDREGMNAQDEVGSKTADYANLGITERIADINERAGAKNTKGEGAGQSTYEPPRTEAATVSDAAHAHRKHGTEIAVGPTCSEQHLEALAVWWQAYLAPYGGGAAIPAKVVRVTEELAAAARERLTCVPEQYPSHASCPTCGTSPLSVDEPTLTLRCPECGMICFVSMPKGTQYVGTKQSLTPEEEMDAVWEKRTNT